MVVRGRLYTPTRPWVTRRQGSNRSACRAVPIQPQRASKPTPAVLQDRLAKTGGDRVPLGLCCVEAVFDGDPVFCNLLNGHDGNADSGVFEIELDDFARCTDTALRQLGYATEAPLSIWKSRGHVILPADISAHERLRAIASFKGMNKGR